MSPPVQGMGRPFELLRELGQTYRSLERDSVQAQLHQAESEAKINFLETQLLVQEKLNLDLGRRVKMLERILLKERHELRLLKKTLAEGGGGRKEVEVEKNKAGKGVGEREGADEAAETDTTTTSEEAAGSSSSTTSATSEAEVTSTTSTDADAGKAVASSSANAAPGEAGGEIGGMKSTKTTPARSAADSNTSSSPEQETKGGAAPGAAGAGGAPSSSSSAGTASSTLSKLSEIAQRLPQTRAVSARQKLRQYLQTSLFLNDTLEADLLDQIGSALSAHVTSGGSKSSSSSGQRSSSSSCTFRAAQTLARAASSCSRTSEKESPGAATSSSSQPSKTRRGSGGDTSSLSDQVQVSSSEKQKRAVKAKAAAAARDGRSEAEDQVQLLEQQSDDHHHSTSAPGGEIPEINSEVVPHQTSTELAKQDWRWYASVEGPFCGAVQKLCYDNQRAILISGSEDGVMCLFDMHDFNTSEDVEPFHVLRNPGGRKITAMAADFVTSNIFVTGDISGSVTLWKVGLRAHTAAQETAELRDKNKQTPPVLEEKPSKGSSFDFLEEITDLSLRAPHIIAVSTRTEVHLLKISPHNPALGLSKINTVFKPYQEEEEVDHLDTAGEDNLVSAVEKKSKLESDSDSEEDKGKEVKESGSIKKGSSRSLTTRYYPSQVAFVKDDLLVVGFRCLTAVQQGNASTRTIKSATMYEIVEEDEESAKKSTDDKSKGDDGERGKVEEDVENEGGKEHKDGNESATKKNSSTSSAKEGASKNGDDDVDDGGRSGSSLGRLVLKEVLTYKTSSVVTSAEETTTTLMKILLPSVLATVGTSVGGIVNAKNSVGEILKAASGVGNAASVLRLWDLPTGKNIAEEDFAVLATEQGLLPPQNSATSTRRVDITGLSYDSATGKVVLGVGSLGEVWVYDVKGQSITQRIESFTESLDALLLGVEDVLFVGGLSVCQRSSGAEISSVDDHRDGAAGVEKMEGKGKESPSSSTGGENKEKGSMVTSTRNRWGHVRILTR